MHEHANFLGMSGLEATKHVALISVGSNPGQVNHAKHDTKNNMC